MAGSDHRASILRTLRISSRPLDDDELAANLKIEPRQTVNQICRRLRDEGLIDRISGPNGKIVNVLRADARATRGEDAGEVGKGPEASAAPSEPADAEIARLAGNSSEQRTAEAHLLRGLSRHQATRTHQAVRTV